MLAGLLENILRKVRRFAANSGGNVAITTALAMVPMVTAVGCVMDYTSASMIKTKLQAAADAASLATVSANSTVVDTAQAMSGAGAVTGGSTYATNFFNANLAQAPASTGYTNLTPTSTVTLSGTTMTATVSFTAQVPTNFLGLIGYKNIAVSGTSSAAYSFPTYISFYMMLDVSGSMSFPSTTAEQTRLQAVNPDNYTIYPNGCTFACHFTSQGACTQSEQRTNVPPSSYTSKYNPSPGGYCQGFTITRLGTTPAACTSTSNCSNITPTSINWSNTVVSSCATAGTASCIQLRADAVGYAVSQLLAYAQSSEQVTNQFQVGLYPFIQNLYTYSAMTTNLTGTIATNAANLASLLDTGVNTSLGSGGTHFENAFSSINSTISSVGTGVSSSSPLPYIFIVTDGSEDYQTQSGGNWSSQNWSSNSTVPYQNSATTIPPNSVTSTDYCTNMKKRGIKIAVLYIPYMTIQNPTNFASNEDVYANNNIPNIPAALQKCASPNFYYTANTPADINNALLAMFDQAVSTAHLSN
ncbi:MAG TPA: pilus assembly protein TadG-related protein [Xanthobacteraceae bacterium]|nr:pilus assembly protein TadG-related protein [Xanthobacteraceae bacterium]